MTEKDNMPNEDIWPKILETVDKHEEVISIAVIAMLLSSRKNINSNFINILRSKDEKKVDKFLKTITFNGNKLKLSLNELIKDIGKKIDNEYKTGIDIKNISGKKFMDKYVADLIVQVSDNTKLLVKELIKEGWENEIIPKQLAKNIKEVIPLDPRRARTIERYRQSLYKNKELVNRFKNKKDLENEINRLYKKKHEQLLFDRGVTITRTESMNIANEGSRRMYEEMAKNDSYIRNNYCLFWIVTNDDLLCDQCRQMIGQTCSFNGNFGNKSGSKSAQTIKQLGVLRRPTLHPKCRCCLVCGPKR